jgi:hypothetical protein
MFETWLSRGAGSGKVETPSWRGSSTSDALSLVRAVARVGLESGKRRRGLGGEKRDEVQGKV